MHRALFGFKVGLISTLIFLSAVPLAYAYPFTSATNISAGSKPNGIVTADFNHDGIQDIAVTNNDTHQLSVILGQANMAFGSPTGFTVANDPAGIATGDFDGDGELDLITTSRSADRVSLLLGNGDGRFVFLNNYGAGTDPYAIITADFNNDGKLDAAVANIGNDNVSVLIGRGDGTFDAQVTYIVGTDPVDLVAKDIDGDGYLDLMVANSCAGCFIPYNAGGFSLLMNRRDGSFAAKVDFNATKGVTGIASADLDGDNFPDVVVSRKNTNNIGVFLNDTRGSFGAMTTYNTDASPFGIVLGDFNADGDADAAVVTTGGPNISILNGDGRGVFAAYTTTSAIGSSPRKIVSADFDRDGRLDLATHNFASDNVSILLDAAPPAVNTVTPSSGNKGSGAYLIINGSGFAPNTIVKNGGVEVNTSFTSNNELHAWLSGVDTANLGSLSLSIYNPSPGVSSNNFGFSVVEPATIGSTPAPSGFYNLPAGPFDLVINDGSGTVNSRQVAIKPSAGSNVSRLAISNREDFAEAAQEKFVPSMSWDLCSSGGGVTLKPTCPDGEYLVYAKFFTDYGQSSPTIVKKVALKTTNKPTTTVTAGQNPSPSIITYKFMRNLRLGMSGGDVKQLQILLNQQGFTLAASGPGSNGLETTLFGSATQKALIKFQEAHRQDVLTPIGLTSGTGYFGNLTRNIVNK